MSSPFATLEDFNSAIDGPTEGAIYTFASNPMINNIALIVAVGLFFWFIVKTYNTHAEPSRLDKSMNHLSSFIVAGLLSMLAINYQHPNQKPATIQRTATESWQAAVRDSSRQLPLGLLGMIGFNLSTFGHKRSRRKSRSRRWSRPRR